jgi:uncharacterized lipoprotein YmbA
MKGLGGVRGALAGALFVCVLGLGCLGRSPRPEFYRLSATAGDGQVASLSQLGLAIDAMEFPLYLDRPEIVTRSGAYQLELSNGPRWAGSLRSEVRRVVADDLAALLNTTRVAVYPEEPRFPVDYRLFLDVRTFEGTRGQSVTLVARFVVAGPDGRALAVEQSRIEEPIASASWDDYAAASSAALGALTRQIADTIAVLAEGTPETE